MKTKGQVLEGFLDGKKYNLHLEWQGHKVLDSFPCLGSIVHNSGRSCRVVSSSGLARPTVLWAHSAQVFSVIGNSAEGNGPNLQVACAPCPTMWL